MNDMTQSDPTREALLAVPFFKDDETRDMTPIGTAALMRDYRRRLLAALPTTPTPTWCPEHRAYDHCEDAELARLAALPTTPTPSLDMAATIVAERLATDGHAEGNGYLYAGLAYIDHEFRARLNPDGHKCGYGKFPCPHRERALAALPTTPTPPEGTRLVLMSEELALALGADRVEWGEPDVNGWYTPILYRSTP